jgi:catechol 2,3-dioxygenase-like lactoylglutathione lyase family enzyme
MNFSESELRHVSSHHVAISVRRLDATVGFYGVFGYELALQWDAPDGSLAIAHLRNGGGHIVEVFAYAANHGLPVPDPAAVPEGNDLEVPGVKHFGVRVEDLVEAHRRAVATWPERTTPMRRGRTQIDYFWVADPDSIWVEVVQDDRDLSPTPIFLP